VIGELPQWCGVDGATLLRQWRRVDGFAVHAAIANGAVLGPDDIAANHYRVDGRAVHPTGYVPVDPASNHHRTMQWCGVDGAVHVPVDPASNHHRTMLSP